MDPPHPRLDWLNTVLLVGLGVVGFLIKLEIGDMKDRISRLESAFINAGASAFIHPKGAP
jgi:hypothetical protein